MNVVARGGSDPTDELLELRPGGSADRADATLTQQWFRNVPRIRAWWTSRGLGVLLVPDPGSVEFFHQTSEHLDRDRAGFTHLESVVKGKPVEEDVGEELSEAEDAVDHPVGQPLGVVLFARALDGFDPADIKETRLRTRRPPLRSAPDGQLTSNTPGRRSR